MHKRIYNNTFAYMNTYIYAFWSIDGYINDRSIFEFIWNHALYMWKNCNIIYY